MKKNNNDFPLRSAAKEIKMSFTLTAVVDLVLGCIMLFAPAHVTQLLCMLVGAGITAAIQSSSATTVMVVGFVNSGMMTLRQAVWIIMGANIGTTVTGLLIALDVGALAPLLAFVGVALVVFLKKPILHHWGQIIAGLGVLFLGMGMMSDAMAPLRESEFFINLMTQMSNPLLGILVGMVFTAIIQSSSASVGILQTLASSGLIGLHSAAFILFGQNIGTCITAVLASIGTSRNAKRTTIIHLLFNVIGTVIFTTICILTPLTDLFESLLPTSPAGQIAALHTTFNITTTLLLLPFGTQLAKIAERILPDRASDNVNQRRLLYIKPVDHTHEQHRIGTSAIAINGISRELNRMAEIVENNVRESFLTVLDGTPKRLPAVEDTEETIDFLNKEISSYISSVIVYETNEADSARISAFFKISGNLERIGDHAMNISEYTKLMEQKKIDFSEDTKAEIRQMQTVSLEAMQLIYPLESITAARLEKIAQLEQKIDDMTDAMRQNQLQRMHAGADESAVIYSELLTDFERIGDHILNIGEAMTQISAPEYAYSPAEE